MSRLAPLAALALAAALAACQRAPASPAAAGELTFNAVGCVKCHSIGGKGGTYGPDLTFIGFRKSSAWLDTWLKDPHAWRKDTVMPGFHLPDGIRADLVAFLSTQKGQAWTAEQRPWNHPDLMAKGQSIKRGSVIFEKAGCVACHSAEGRGGYPNNNVVGDQIPSLSKVFEGYTKAELVAKIRGGVVPTPADPSAAAPLIQMPKWGDVLKKDEISAVADYLISLGKKHEKAEHAADDF